MTPILTVLLTCGLVLTVHTGQLLAQSSAPNATSNAVASKPLLTLQMPALPEPVRVVLKPATTALFVSDMIDPTCKSQPKCTGTSRDRVRSGYRPVPNIESEQRKCHERAPEAEGFNLEPHRYDHFPVKEPQRSAHLHLNPLSEAHSS